jgi:hypothetical protein
MATTNFDICNRALTLLGSRKTINSFTQDSLEAQTANQSFTPTMNWCFGLANWNFARQTAALVITKGPPTTSPGAWTTAVPSPPWLYQYGLPVDYMRAVYMTNNAAAATGPGYAGEPQRYAIVEDTTGVTVLVTNSATCNLIYTAYVVSPTNWPFYFERLAVLALAQNMCMSLTGNLELLNWLAAGLEQQIAIAMQLNKLEGLVIEDNTPEWIQALGINYPFRRISPEALPGPMQQPATTITQPKPRGRQ